MWLIFVSPSPQTKLSLRHHSSHQCSCPSHVHITTRVWSIRLINWRIDGTTVICNYGEWSVCVSVWIGTVAMQQPQRRKAVRDTIHNWHLNIRFETIHRAFRFCFGRQDRQWRTREKEKRRRGESGIVSYFLSTTFKTFDLLFNDGQTVFSTFRKLHLKFQCCGIDVLLQQLHTHTTLAKSTNIATVVVFAPWLGYCVVDKNRLLLFAFASLMCACACVCVRIRPFGRRFVAIYFVADRLLSLILLLFRRIFLSLQSDHHQFTRGAQCPL